jgi:fido (protein-threonine AMPylation protein)
VLDIKGEMMLFNFKNSAAGNRFDGIPSEPQWQELTKVKTLFYVHNRNNVLLHAIDSALFLHDSFMKSHNDSNAERHISSLDFKSIEKSIQLDAYQSSILGAVYDACIAWLGSKEQVKASNRRDVVIRLAANSKTAHSLLLENIYKSINRLGFNERLALALTNCSDDIDRSDNDLAISCLSNLRSNINRISADLGLGSCVLVDLSRSIHSEILSRLTPQIKSQYESYKRTRQISEIDTIPISIKGKYQMSKMISEELIKIFDTQSIELTSPARLTTESELTDVLRGIHLPLSIVQRRKLDTLRLGSSDTLKGKSGGGEAVGGAKRAKDNWMEADGFVESLARNKKRTITISDLQEINRILNQGMPNNGGVPGELRLVEETAGIGDRYPGPEFVPFLMGDLMRWLENSEGKVGPVELAAVCYQRFISIHPFSDGNGRTGRLFADCILERCGAIPAAYDGSDAFVAVFGVPQKGTVNVTTELAVERVFSALKRSAEVLRPI